MEDKKRRGTATDESREESFSRRDFIRGLAPATTLGVMAGASYLNSHSLQDSDLEILGFDPTDTRSEAPEIQLTPGGETINLGIIGVGIRGKDVLKAAGYAQPDQLEETERLGTDGQVPLNSRLVAVCDLFEPYSEWGVHGSGDVAKAYRDYRELLGDPDVDAVIIAAPDHWHAQMTMDAAEAGKHVYVEKCFTHTPEQAFLVRDAVKKHGIVLQLGHQSRSNPGHETARRLVAEGILGEITLIHTYTNRNSEDGAWIYEIPENASARNIDWERFLGSAPDTAFDLDRFFRWRKYWDYGTGLSGDMFTHQWDAVDTILGDIGLPATASASGGVYYWKDGREVPDVYQVTYEYPDRNLSLVYNASLASSLRRGRIFLGSDAVMDMTEGIMVHADRDSKRYADLIEKGAIEVDRPIISYQQDSGRRMEAITSPTQRWTLGKGILYTSNSSGELVNLTYLHLRNWLEAIRNESKASCHEDIAFREAITAHMGTLSLKWGCRVRWNAELQKIEPDLHFSQEITA